MQIIIQSLNEFYSTINFPLLVATVIFLLPIFTFIDDGFKLSSNRVIRSIQWSLFSIILVSIISIFMVIYLGIVTITFTNP